MQEKNMGNLLVIGQFTLLGALIALPSGKDWAVVEATNLAGFALLTVGLVIAFAAIFKLGKSLSANPVPLEKAELKTDGLYGLVRHPIYLGFLLGAVGLAIRSGSVWSLLLLIALAVLLNFKARFEERLLLAKFVSYKEYATRVGRLVPGLGKLKN
ncbi:MAG: hypothetical protein RL196_566 [Actinomycetota bacterium]|jgi:protein-S-isoprenylcysteine O-methyltransferase Ste14